MQGGVSYRVWTSAIARYTLVGFAYLFIACKSPGATGDLLSRYAKIDARRADTYIHFYRQGLHLGIKSHALEKARAFTFAAKLESDQKIDCAAADCLLASLQALPAKRRSPLFSYAVFHLASLAEKEADFQLALRWLALADNPPAPLLRKLSLLKGRVLGFINATEAATHFATHIDKFEDAESLYLAADAFARAGDKKRALATAYRALEKPAADSPFSQSGLLVRNILNKEIYALPDVALQIRLMEALRVAKDKASALKLYDVLKSKKIGDAEGLLFAHYASRLMIDRKQFAAVANLIRPIGEKFFEAENEKAALDICERLLKKKQFGLVSSLYAIESPTKSRLQCQLRRAQRESKFDLAARKIAGDYIRNFDGESTLAERVYLRSCLPASKSRTVEVSLACLEDLRALTAQRTIGAGARYYLGREYDRMHDDTKVRAMLAEIAQNYNDDFYYFHLIEKPLRAQIAWGENFTAESGRENKILSALVFRDLHRAADIAVLAPLAALERDVAATAQSFDETRQLALLLLAADSRGEARELLRSDEKERVYRDLIALGGVAEKPDIALFGVKQFVRAKKLRPFLFEIPQSLRNLLYPTAYSAAVEKYGNKQGIAPPEIFALIRQESQFFPEALSVAKAQGLMQLLPSTARLVATKEGLRSYNLMRPEDNIRLGTAFMRDIMNSYTADYIGLAIAYNAGPGRYTQWKKKLSADEDFFIEEIPFQETYQYVRILLADRAKYRALLKSK